MCNSQHTSNGIKNVTLTLPGKTKQRVEGLVWSVERQNKLCVQRLLVPSFSSFVGLSRLDFIRPAAVCSPSAARCLSPVRSASRLPDCRLIRAVTAPKLPLSLHLSPTPLLFTVCLFHISSPVFLLSPPLHLLPPLWSLCRLFSRYLPPHRPCARTTRVPFSIPPRHVIRSPGGMMDFSRAGNSLLPGYGGSGLCWISRSDGAGVYAEKTADKKQ